MAAQGGDDAVALDELDAAVALVDEDTGGGDASQAAQDDGTGDSGGADAEVTANEAAGAQGDAAPTTADAEEAVEAPKAAASAGDGGDDDDGDDDEAMEFEEAEVDPTFRTIEECEAILERARAANRRRAERFGAPYQEPNKWALLTRTEIQRLRAKEDAMVREQIAAKRGPGFVRGVDPNDEEEQRRRAARAAKFGPMPAAAAAAPGGKEAEEEATSEAEMVPMLTADERRDRESRRERAKRFGVPFEEDVAVARAAWQALGKTWTIADDKSVRPIIRKSAIHVRAREYLCASNKDLQNLFGSYGIKWVEWLNGQCVNVLFADAESAGRAMKDISEPIPRAEGVPRVHSQWRHAVKMLVKSKSDAYGPRGSLTKVYLRYATNRDVKELAKRTKGPRSMFGRRARKPKRPRAPVEPSAADRQRQEDRKRQQVADLDSALDSYRTASAAPATDGATDASPDALGAARGAKRRRKREHGDSAILRTDNLAAVVGADVLQAARHARPQTAQEQAASLDAALDAYLGKSAAPAPPAPAAATPAAAADASSTVASGSGDAEA